MNSRMYRNIIYGYYIQNGTITIHSQEAEVVKEIFKNYINGQSLKEISNKLNERHISFSQNQATWNKNKINRIIEEKKYIGLNNYPKIINIDDFTNANQLKISKGCKNIVCSSLEKNIKRIINCSFCGGTYNLVKTSYGKRELKCKNRCKCEKNIYLDDLIKSIYFASIEFLNRNEINEKNDIDKNKEILLAEMKYKNDIKKLLENEIENFNTTKKIIMEMASKRFRSYKTYLNGETKYIIENIKKIKNIQDINNEYIRKVIKKIKINKTGVVEIIFLNDIKIEIMIGEY